jgi:hypothetical protein
MNTDEVVTFTTFSRIGGKHGGTRDMFSAASFSGEVLYAAILLLRPFTNIEYLTPKRNCFKRKTTLAKGSDGTTKKMVALLTEPLGTTTIRYSVGASGDRALFHWINAKSEDTLTKERPRGGDRGGGTGVATTTLEMLPIHLAPLDARAKRKRK